ncbi:MAG: hypothetical protein N2319_05690 [Candidatus Kapabacteria bacterium]|nr:hypothetical protein [Candidatus Kapabacteria bacterium]
MKVKILLLFITLSIPSFASEVPFTLERMTTFFTGVYADNNIILAYGGGSIILKSTDTGNNWTQLAIANDSLDILKIKKFSNKFYGILDKDYIIISEDGGNNWNLNKISHNEQILDFDLDSESIYVLQKKVIAIFDNNLKLVKQISIDTSYNSRAINLIENHIFLASDSGKIITLDIKKDYEMKIIDFKEMGFCNECLRVKDIQYSNSKIYLMITPNVYLSSDTGKSWVLAANGGNVVRVYQDSIFSVNAGSQGDLIGGLIWLWKWEDNGYKIITDRSKIKRRYTYMISVSDYTFINRDTIVAVGGDKYITISYDGGRNWVLKSNIRYNNLSGFFWIDSTSALFHSGVGQVFKTTDGWVTFLPQYYTEKDITKFTRVDASYYQKGGFGFSYKYQSDYTAPNFILTKDFGEHYTIIRDENIAGYSVEVRAMILQKDSIFLLYTQGHWKDWRFTQIFFYDSNLNFLGKKIIDSMHIMDIKRINDNKLLCFGRDYRYYNGKDYDSIDFFIAYSYDGGLSWERDFQFSIPDTHFSIGLQLIGDYAYARGLIWDSSGKNINFIYRIDLVNKKVERLFRHDKQQHDLSNYFQMGNYIITGGWEYLLYNDNIDKNPYDWKQIPFPNYYITFTDKYFEKNTIYSSAFNIKLGATFLYKCKFKEPITKVDIGIETATKLYCFPPYPQPANNHINIKLYWDLSYDINNADFSVYNFLGEKVAGKEEFILTYEKDYSGILKWDCSKVNNGFYVVVIKHGNTIKSIPVIIMK